MAAVGGAPKDLHLECTRRALEATVPDSKVPFPVASRAFGGQVHVMHVDHCHRVLGEMRVETARKSSERIGVWISWDTLHFFYL